MLSKAYGQQTSLNVVICENADDAIQRGYSKDKLYASAKPVEIKQAVVVKDGTLEGNSTVDLFMEDEDGNKYVVMITGGLLRNIPTVFPKKPEADQQVAADERQQ